MRAVFFVLSALLLTGSAGAQTLDFSQAPQEFLGYSFGSSEASVTDAVKAANRPFTAQAARVAGGESKLILTKQTVDKLENATVELAFQNGVLYQVSASLPFSADAAQGLRDVLSAKYGKVKSVDGGYRYNWFFTKADHAAGSPPEFALILNVDQVNKAIRLVYADNAAKTKPGSAAPATPAPAPAPAAALNPSSF